MKVMDAIDDLNIRREMPDIMFMVMGEELMSASVDDSNKMYEYIDLRNQQFEMGLDSKVVYNLCMALDVKTFGKINVVMLLLLEDNKNEEDATVENYMQTFTKGKFDDEGWDKIITLIKNMDGDAYPFAKFY